MNGNIASSGMNCACLAVLATAWSVGAAEIKVSPDGALRTPRQALSEIRKLRQIGAVGSNETVTVTFAPGTYRLSETLVFGPADSFVTFVGAEGGGTAFSGARTITGFRAGPDGIWRAPVPKGVSFSQLWVNGRRAERARSPNRGYYYIRERLGEDVDPETGKLANLDKIAYRFSTANAAELAAIPRDELRDAVIHAVYAWDDDFVRPTYADAKTGIVKFLTPFGRDPMYWGNWMTRCRFENFRSALDEAGEWYLDRKRGELLYLPLSGEVPERTVAEAPVVGSLVEVGVGGGAFTEGVRFRNIAFSHQGWTCGRAFFTGQGVCGLDAAMVTVERARRVAFEDCTFAHTSAYALWWRDACFDGSVVRSHFHDLGSGGVRISHSQTNPKKYDRANICRRITVEECIVRDSGHVFPGGVAVIVQRAYDCRVLHNEIFDCLYTGISHGWTWGYGKQPCGGHEIAFNHIHDLGLNEMCDMGGIYSLGPSPNTRVHDNWIHDIWSYQYTGSGGCGLYTDEGSSGIVLENNLVHDTQTSCVNQHYGRENVFRNNIFAYPAVKKDPIPVVVRHRDEQHLSCVVSNNIIVIGAGRAAVGKPNSRLEKDTVFGGNLYVPDGADLKSAFAGLSFAGWQALGMDSGSAVGDAKFRNLAERDFTLEADSPALRMGFRPFEWRRAGLSDQSRRRYAAALPKRTRTPHFEPEKVPPKKSFHTSFEAAKPGGGCPLALGPHGGSIRVTDREAHTGRNSLAYADQPGQTGYLPHSAHGFKRIGNRLVYVFSIKYEEKTNFGFDMRDYGGKPANGQFSTGPHVGVVKGVLHAGNFASKIAKPGKWVTCRIVHDLGPVDEPGKATWHLEVTDDAGGREVSETFKVEATYRQPGWAGFMSWATCETVFYLDDVGYDWE